MRESNFTIQQMACFVAVLLLGPLAWEVGGAWDWTPGTATLLFLTGPVCLAGLTGGRVGALLVAELASVAALAAPIVREGEFSEGWPTILSLASCAIFLAIAAASTSVIGRMRQKIAKLKESQDQIIRDLYKNDRSRSDTLTVPAESRAASAPVEADRPDAVNFAMLLLTLQDVARRISTNLDLESLLPTIIGTAKASLKCSDCQVYFYDARERTLRNGLRARARDEGVHVPRADRGMARWALEKRQILTRRNVEEQLTLQHLLDEEVSPPDAIAPLVVGGELLGLLVVDGVEENSPNFVRLLFILANTFAMGIKNAQLFARIEDMARRDGLTGLLNHAAVLREIEDLMSAGDGPVSVVMCDLDRFKAMNDTHGHPAGDRVLQGVADLWRAVLPDTALLARYGGEEFLCVLPGETLARAYELAERLRASTESLTLDFAGRELSVTASFGVADSLASGQTAHEMIRAADQALYRAKELGRNRVVCARPEQSETDTESTGHAARGASSPSTPVN